MFSCVSFTSDRIGFLAALLIPNQKIFQLKTIISNPVKEELITLRSGACGPRVVTVCAGLPNYPIAVVPFHSEICQTVVLHVRTCVWYLHLTFTHENEVQSSLVLTSLSCLLVKSCGCLGETGWWFHPPRGKRNQ